MTKLRAYVRRTLIAAARDYNGGKRRMAESTANACRDAMNGTDTGCGGFDEGCPTFVADLDFAPPEQK